jgi:uncharacterized membrane protein
MPFCEKCGAQVAAGTAFCPGCGAAQSSSGGGGGAGTGTAAGTGLDQNVAGLLSYVAGWITGIIFFVIDKRSYVRFHAAQSMVVFGGVHVLYYVLRFVLGGVLGFGGVWAFWSLYGLILAVLELASFVVWILCMVKAYQGERFKLPLLGDIAESIAGK